MQMLELGRRDIIVQIQDMIDKLNLDKGQNLSLSHYDIQLSSPDGIVLLDNAISLIDQIFTCKRFCHIAVLFFLI